MNRVEDSWNPCYQPDINKMFRIDENRIKGGMGWHKIIMISEHRAPFSDELIRFDDDISNYFPAKEKKIKTIWRRSMEW